jgi:hypothetical protein
VLSLTPELQARSSHQLGRPIQVHARRVLQAPIALRALPTRQIAWQVRNAAMTCQIADLLECLDAGTYSGASGATSSATCQTCNAGYYCLAGASAGTPCVGEQRHEPGLIHLSVLQQGATIRILARHQLRRAPRVQQATTVLQAALGRLSAHRVSFLLEGCMLIPSCSDTYNPNNGRSSITDCTAW